MTITNPLNFNGMGCAQNIQTCSENKGSTKRMNTLKFQVSTKKKYIPSHTQGNKRSSSFWNDNGVLGRCEHSVWHFLGRNHVRVHILSTNIYKLFWFLNYIYIQKFSLSKMLRENLKLLHIWGRSRPAPGGFVLHGGCPKGQGSPEICRPTWLYGFCFGVVKWLWCLWFGGWGWPWCSVNHHQHRPNAHWESGNLTHRTKGWLNSLSCWGQHQLAVRGSPSTRPLSWEKTDTNWITTRYINLIINPIKSHYVDGYPLVN